MLLQIINNNNALSSGPENETLDSADKCDGSVSEEFSDSEEENDPLSLQLFQSPALAEQKAEELEIMIKKLQSQVLVLQNNLNAAESRQLVLESENESLKEQNKRLERKVSHLSDLSTKSGDRNFNSVRPIGNNQAAPAQKHDHRSEKSNNNVGPVTGHSNKTQKSLGQRTKLISTQPKSGSYVPKR